MPCGGGRRSRDAVRGPLGRSAPQDVGKQAGIPLRPHSGGPLAPRSTPTCQCLGPQRRSARRLACASARSPIRGSPSCGQRWRRLSTPGGPPSRTAQSARRSRSTGLTRRRRFDSDSSGSPRSSSRSARPRLARRRSSAGGRRSHSTSIDRMRSARASRSWSASRSRGSSPEARHLAERAVRSVVNPQRGCGSAPMTGGDLAATLRHDGNGFNARGDRRHSARRAHASPACAARGRRRVAAGLFRRAVATEPVSPFPWVAGDGPAARRPVARSRLARSRIAGRRARGHDRRPRRLCAAPRPDDRRGRLRRRRRAAGPRRRHAPARAASPRSRPSMGSSASSPRSCRTTAPCFSVFERRRVRGDARARGRRDRGRVPDRADGGVPRAVDRRDHEAVAHRCEPFFAPRAVAVLGASPRRGSIGGELFRNVLARRLPGRGLPGQPRRRAGRRRPRVRVGRGDPGPRRPRHHLRPRRARARRGRVVPRGTGIRALCVISAGFAEVGRGGRGAPGASCSRSSARTAAG